MRELATARRILLEFIVAGPPVSQQTRRRQRLKDWIGIVRHQAAAAQRSGGTAVANPVEVEITFLFDTTLIDIDNLAKPFLDALNGIGFRDDEQVTDLLLRKRDLGRRIEVARPRSWRQDSTLG